MASHSTPPNRSSNAPGGSLGKGSSGSGFAGTHAAMHFQNQKRKYTQMLIHHHDQSCQNPAATAAATDTISSRNTISSSNTTNNHISPLGNQPNNNTSSSSSSSTTSSNNTNIDSVMDDVAAMNEIGIANLYAGDAMVAKESFINALSRCANALSSNCLHQLVVVSKEQGSSGSSRKKNKTNSTTSVLTSVFDIQSHQGVGGMIGETSIPTGSTTTAAAVTSRIPLPIVPADSQVSSTSGDNTAAGVAAINTTASTTDLTNSHLLYVYQREEYDEGMYVYKEALYLDKESSMCKHLRDSILMYNVGQTHLRTRQYQDAKRWFFMSLERFSQECPPSLSSSFSQTILNDVKIHHNIAFCCYCLGENKQAMSHYQTAFSRLQQLGLGDLDVAACSNSIGILHLCGGSMDDSFKAMECLQLALSIYKRILGIDSPRVATCFSNIARVFFSRQNYETSLTLFQKALKIREEQSAKGLAAPVDQAAALFNIGQTYQKLGKPEPALNYFQAFRKLAEPHLGKGHRDIATCIKAMACIHYEQGNLQISCKLLEEALDSSRKEPQQTPMELACLLRDMGCLYSMTDQLDKALESHLRSLRIQQQIYEGDDLNPNIMVTLLHIAQTKKKQGDYQSAFDVYRAVYSIQLDVFGPASLEVAATLCSIGLMLYLKHDLKSSINYYQEALRVRQDFFGTNDNFDIAATFNSIGLIAFKMSRLGLARTSFEECIRIRVKLEGTACHRDIVTLYSNLGTVYLANGQDKEAIQMFSESIRLERKTLGAKHLGVALSLQHLAQLHQDRGELELAQEYFVEALKITRNADDSSMANKAKTLATLYNLLGNIHLMRAEVPEMMECFIEASRIASSGCQSLIIAGYTFYGISKIHPPCAPEA